MSRQKEESDLGNSKHNLGISLRDMATILQTGKKLTRGAKNQLKISLIERQQGEKQSEMSFDSRKSIETRKDNKKNEKQAKKKEPVKVQVPQQLPHFLGVPNLQKYLQSDTLTVQTSYDISKFNVVQLGKNYFPSLLRVLLRNNLTKEIYQVKRGELKRQKTTKDQFIIEFQHFTTNRNEVRSITRQNGIVLIGQNLAMLKLNFSQWKNIFSQQIEAMKKQFQSSSEKLEQQGQKEDDQKKKQNQGIVQEILSEQKIEEEKSLQFVQIFPNPLRQFTLQNQSIEHQHDAKNIGSQNLKIDEEKSQDNRMIPQGQEHISDGLHQEQIFKKFCFPQCQFMLWPVLMYDEVLGDEDELDEILQSKKYNFSEKDRTGLFDSISKSKDGFFTERSGQSKSKKDIKEKQKMIGCFENLITPKMQSFAQKRENLGSQLNLIVYPFGLNKLIRLKEQSQLELYPMSIFPDQFLNPLIFGTVLKQCAQQICQSILRLNQFAQLQVTQTKSEEARSSIDRLVKCQIDNKVYKGIVLRYSNVQKKMLVMLFKEGVRNEMKWVGVEQVYCNYTVPQISVKSKFLLYDTNEPNPKHQKLTSLFNQIYASFFNKQVHKNFNKDIQESNQNLSTISPVHSLPSITRPSIPNRCTTCYYPIHRLAYYKCFFCDNYSHQQCSQKIINKSIQLNAQSSQNLWTCDHCQPCVVCLQPLKNQTISCSKCHTNLHQICAKLKLQQNLIRDKYCCQNCIQCKICQKKLKNLDYVLIKNGYQCINCYKAQQANQICHICKKQSDGRWAQCSRQFCGKWIHKNCDKYIQTRNSFFSTNNQEVYYCPFCRCIEKRRLILKFIEIISVFDEYQYFISSDYEDILDYKYVITNSMCFRKMNERCYEGCYDTNTLEEIKKDFELIISNALKYNMPKDQPHYQARILNVLGQFAFEKFRQELECTEEQIIRGGLIQRMIEKKKEMYKEVYERYLEIILNFRAKWSSVEVRRPKENIKVVEKNPASQLHQFEQYGFNSKHLLKDVFRSAMIKFKLKKKPATIQNLFETQKVIQAYKSTINSNFCYYHYWNSNTKFYCHQCMEYYCCVEKCYRHQICRYCGIKGCACDAYQCGCQTLKEKDRKMYEKQLIEKFYDRREITQNYKLCLKCAFQKLNNKFCTYCEKSYEFYYDFQTCQQCNKIYHKQCADQHASESLSKFFFKHPQKSNQSQLFSTTLRLNNHCYECSITKGNKLQMFEKLKRQSLEKLAKIQKLSKYQLLIVSILFENGIKLSLCDVLGLIMDNYEQFLAHESIFEEYRINYASVKFNDKLNKKMEQRLQHVVKANFIEKSMRQKEIDEFKQKIMSEIENKNKLIQTSIRYLTPQIVGNIIFNIQNLWSAKQHYKMLHFLISKQHQYHLSSIFNKNTLNQSKTQLTLQRYEEIKSRFKLQKILGDKVDFNNILTNPQIVSKKGTGQSNNQKSTGNNKQGGSDKNIGNKQGNNLNKSQNKNNNEISKQQSNKLLYCLIDGMNIFNSFEEIQIINIDKKHDQQNNRSKKRSQFLINNDHSINILASRRVDQTIFMVNFSNKDDLIYDFAQQNDNDRKMIQEIQQSQQNNKSIVQSQKKIQQQQQNIFQQEIDLQRTLQQMVQQQNYNKKPTKNITLEQQVINIYSTHTNISKLSKYNHLSKIHSIITKFILKCFQYSKSVYRRGNTCLLKTQKDHWRLLKKYQQINQHHMNHSQANYGNNYTVYEISLKKENNKWFFSINQNIWWVQTVQQIIQKLKVIVNLNNFRQLADFLGFTFRLVPLQKAHHFSKFLRTHPLDDLSAKDKKKLVIDLYDKFEWGKNGLCKNKVMNTINDGEQIIREQVRQYVSAKKGLFYLGRRKKVKQQESTIVKQRSSQPYITYQDMKRDLQEISGHPSAAKKQFQPKQYEINQTRVFIGPSPIHKLGLFAKQNYPKFTTMIQYIGEIVSESTADVREAIFHFGCYMFGLNRRNVDRRDIIDATFRGNMARYLNHSCDPNCKAKIQLINNQPKIFIYSIRDIQQFQELTYDYQFSVDANQKLTCTCGAKNCQGRLN